MKQDQLLEKTGHIPHEVVVARLVYSSIAEREEHSESSRMHTVAGIDMRWTVMGERDNFYMRDFFGQRKSSDHLASTSIK